MIFTNFWPLCEFVHFLLDSCVKRLDRLVLHFGKTRAKISLHCVVLRSSENYQRPKTLRYGISHSQPEIKSNNVFCYVTKKIFGKCQKISFRHIPKIISWWRSKSFFITWRKIFFPCDEIKIRKINFRDVTKIYFSSRDEKNFYQMQKNVFLSRDENLFVVTYWKLFVATYRKIIWRHVSKTNFSSRLEK